MTRVFACVASVALLGTVLTMSSVVSANGLYRWIDADGRVHFSDRAPDVGVVPSEVERLPTPQFVDPGVPPGHYSVTEQWQRMQAERLARQEQQRERARQAREFALREREVAAAERAAEQPTVSSAVGYPVWTGPRRHYHKHKPVRPVPYSGLWKPDHPAFRAPSHPYARPKPKAGAVVRIE